MRETTRTVATPTARPPVDRGGAGVSRLQTGFEAPVQRSVLAKAEAFVTPAPKPKSPATNKPGEVAPPLPDSELRRALDEAHRLALGNNANGAAVDSWMARARELAAQNNNDFNAVKYALHSELLGKKPATNKPGEVAAPLPDSELSRALDEASRLVFGNNANGADKATWMARARELAAQNNNDFNAVKYALHSELLGKKPATNKPGEVAPPLPDSELRRALDDAHQLVFGGKPTGPNVDTWTARARELAAQNNNDFNAVKFALHSELLAASR